MTEVNDAPSWTAGSSVPLPSEFGYGGGVGGEGNGGGGGESEDWKYHAAEFAKGLAEMSVEFGRGCRDVVKQSVLTKNSYVMRNFGEPCAKVCARLRFLNEYLPEDRDPVHAWSVIFLVSIVAIAALCVNTGQDTTAPLVKRLYIHPPNASRILLPDGRHLAYQEQGVPADRARFSIISAHPFLSSRLAGIPGLKASVLEEFGIRLVTYDLPGFGESDPHPNRNLQSSALDMLQLSYAVGVTDKFWVLGYSGGSMHAWAALRYIPDRVAGAVMVAPMVNPYETRMTKKERSRIWESWTSQRKLMYFLARRFPRFLPYFYRRSFLSGKHGQIDKWLSLSLGKRDRALIEEPIYEEFWQRDVEESVRRRIVKPFVEEAVLLVSDWGFSLSELKIQTKPHSKGIIFWLKSMFSQSEPELMGFLGPIHIWQGMDDKVVPPSMTDFVQRLLPGAMVHKLLYDGHFTYFYFCDDCHKQIFTTIFGNPQGPLASEVEDQTPIEVNSEEQEEDTLSASPAA
ncbi:3-phosphoshikimate 1-carboxyvinyltransferase [Actinidia chinensis var. chinensis]|uniref:3-phosphoshikimate 1-carboxyvinyltransferase n=1 Tax=Actinidia chinensis var. chinensis TaxID=1590841 RepID=A0A2R6P7L8_ACTCC|nr:3-phosphoshikimate 1-carboxyvinyltransferase [Actinidia chinensis var. chinensis]